MEMPFWLDEPAEPLRGGRLDGPVDVAVIGGGVTGCSCALTLADAGKRVRLYEARTIASGASGRNGGFALRGGAMHYDVARARFGPERAAAFWRLTELALDRMAELAGDALAKLVQGRSDADLVQISDMIARMRRARRLCEINWPALACLEYEAIVQAPANRKEHLSELSFGCAAVTAANKSTWRRE